MGQGFAGVTSSGIGGLVKPAIKATSKAAQADKVKAASLKVKVKIKKKV